LTWTTPSLSPLLGQQRPVESPSRLAGREQSEARPSSQSWAVSNSARGASWTAGPRLREAHPDRFTFEVGKLLAAKEPSPGTGENACSTEWRRPLNSRRPSVASSAGEPAGAEKPGRQPSQSTTCTDGHAAKRKADGETRFGSFSTRHREIGFVTVRSVVRTRSRRRAPSAPTNRRWIPGSITRGFGSSAAA